MINHTKKWLMSSMLLCFACQSPIIDQTGNSGNNISNNMIATENSHIGNRQSDDRNNSGSGPQINVRSQGNKEVQQLRNYLAFFVQGNCGIPTGVEFERLIIDIWSKTQQLRSVINTQNLHEQLIAFLISKGIDKGVAELTASYAILLTTSGEFIAQDLMMLSLEDLGKYAALYRKLSPTCTEGFSIDVHLLDETVFVDVLTGLK